MRREKEGHLLCPGKMPAQGHHNFTTHPRFLYIELPSCEREKGREIKTGTQKITVQLSKCPLSFSDLIPYIHL